MNSTLIRFTGIIGDLRAWAKETQVSSLERQVKESRGSSYFDNLRREELKQELAKAERELGRMKR